MTRRVRIATFGVALASGACGTTALPTAALVPVFGPVVSAETISGRVYDDEGGVLLLVGGTSLVRIDIASRAQERTTIRLCEAERCWGLARLADGSMWSLKGRNAIVQFGSDGLILRELALQAPQLGLFGAGDRLVYQAGILPANTPALYASRPGDALRLPWSSMTTRPFEGLASGAAAALNLVGCGATARSEIPCWFPDEPALSLVTRAGETRRLTLEGLPRAAPEVLINASVPQRPVRDVFVDAGGTIWVLSTGTPLAGGKDLPGGWLLARYGPKGEPIDRRLLPKPARLILRAGAGRAVVLTGSGMVAEVLP